MASVSYFSEEDGDLSALAGQQVAIVGYGNLGRPAALNLRQSGVDVVVGSHDDPSAELARSDGFRVLATEEAIATVPVLWLALPDEIVPEVLSTTAPTRPQAGALLVFSSGYCLAYGLVKLPEDVDVALLAPRMIGGRIRGRYESGEGFYSFVSVEQDSTGTAKQRLLAVARAFGALRLPAFEISAATEAALDLFIEQTVGPQLGAAVLSAFEVGTTKGLPPEALALELYLSGEMGATWQAFSEEGFYPGVRLHGHAAAFGGFIRMAELDTDAMKAAFAATLDDIVAGRFAARFQDELANGSPTRELIEAMIKGDDPLTRAEANVRDARGA